VRPDLVFLFSSTHKNPERFFQGYFFQGTDYVFGNGGFDAFRQATGVDELSREDGCYVEVSKQRGGYYRFSADYHGYKKLFYFWDDGFWVVSNSLYRISAHMRQHGRPVPADHAQLAGMATEGTFYPSGRGSFFSQLTSFDTIIQGVRLVPADCALWIGSSGFRLEKTPHLAPRDDYRGRLQCFISTWLGRLNTLLNDPTIQVCCDLTGGLDSRTVFAMLLNAVQGSDSNDASPLQIRSGVGAAMRKDYAVASMICKQFGLPLNDRLRQRPVWLKGKASFSLWKDLCLGAYYPIQFPNMATSGNIVHLGGAGGEIHRPFYRQFLGAPSTADAFVNRRTGNLAVASARPGFEAALRETLIAITENSPGHLDALACHYRHFRNRFHAGCNSQYVASFAPLASKLLDDVTVVAGSRRYRNAQVYYDILYNLKPELLDFPFDSRSKRPGREVRRNITLAAAVPLPSGSCFIGDARVPRAARGKRKDESTAIDHLHQEFQSAKTAFAADFLGEAYIRKTESGLTVAMRKGGFSTAIQSKRVAVVMSCGIFG
jgi:hypothetical protein